MQVTPTEVYNQIIRRAQADPLVAEIIRSCSLEAALEKAVAPTEDLTEPTVEAEEA